MLDHKDVLDATGFLDDRRRKRLTLAQNKLFKDLVDNAEILNRNQQPPAYVRPGDIPEPPVFGYGFEAMLAKL